MKINKKIRSMVKARKTGDRLFLLIMIFASIAAFITQERVLAIVGVQSFALFILHTGYFRTRAYHDALKRDSLIKIDPKIKTEVIDTSFTFSNIIFIIGVIIALIVLGVVSNLAFGLGPILSTIIVFVIGMVSMSIGYLLRWGVILL
jgi:hypothetical protein